MSSGITRAGYEVFTQRLMDVLCNADEFAKGHVARDRFVIVNGEVVLA